MTAPPPESPLTTWQGKENLQIILFEFKINDNSPLLSSGISDKDGFLLQIKECLGKCSGDAWQHVGDVIQLGDSGAYMTSFVDGAGTHVLIRFYPGNKLLTIDIQELQELGQTTFHDFDKLNRFAKLVCRTINANCLRKWTPIPRVSLVPQIYFNSRQQTLVYPFDEILFDQTSPYQSVRILKGPGVGATLVLDDFINLAESDISYTHSLMHKGNIDYANKDVLILGGGDGGLLYELLKENPKFVTMIEIDEVVMEACKVHMRSVCGTVLDKYETDKYKILVGDCFPYLDSYAKDGTQFDFIFSDLTDTPLSLEDNIEFKALMKKVIDMSFKLLRPKGRLLTHLVGVSKESVTVDFETDLKEYGLKFNKISRHVPSFCENWIFYEIFKSEYVQ